MHAIATRGGWDAEGGFVPMPFVSTIAAERRRLRRSWAQMIRRIYEVDPLTCTECGGEMRILAFLLDPAVVRKILDHLAERPQRTRAQPAAAFVATAAGVR